MSGRLRRLFATRRVDGSFDAEIEFHLKMLQKRFIEQGMEPEEAMHAARRQFGNETLLKQTRREMSPFWWIEELARDVRFAWRGLKRNPGFTAVAVLTLALGVGANTAIFSIVKAVLLDPLPYADPGRLVTISETAAIDPDAPGLDYSTASELGRRSRFFEQISAFRDGPGVLVENGIPEMLRGLGVDYDFFDTLGVPMLLGRNFRATEQQSGRRLALILSHNLWMRRFGGDPRILGRVLRLSVYDVKVVGVLPPGFKPLLKATSELTPEMYYPLPFERGGSGAVHLVGRLKRGVAPDEAGAELNALLGPIVHENPAPHLTGARIRVVPLRARLLGRASAALWAVWGAVGFVLLIACANIANLLLARATGRGKEIAVRIALGAGRGRIMRQLLTESVMLALAGGLLGIVLAMAGTGTLASLAPAQIPRVQSAQVDGTVLLFALAVILGSGALFGFAPAWRASHVDLNRTIKDADTTGRTHSGLRTAVTVVEIALAFLVAAGAGLMAKTFWHLISVGAGYDPENVLTLTTCILGPRYSGNPIGYYRDVLERLRAVPGIEGAAMSSLIPMDYTERRPFHREDRPSREDREVPFADEFSVSTGYFRVMRIPLKRGRVFTEQDSETTPRVAVISESCARTQFPGEDPIGRHVKLGGRNGSAPWMTVVGVVGDVRQDGLDHAADMQVYMPLNQRAIINYYRLLARTTGDPMRVEGAVRSVFQSVDPGSPVFHVKPLEGYFSGRLADRTFALALLGLLGVLALVLAAVGIYGVISYSVALRTREVGVRMALGAGWGQVAAMVVRQVLAITAAGLGIGLGASLVLNRLLAGLLFEVRPTDPATLAGAALVLTCVALAAAAIPVRRAATISPVEALRTDG